MNLTRYAVRWAAIASSLVMACASSDRPPAARGTATEPGSSVGDGREGGAADGGDDAGDAGDPCAATVAEGTSDVEEILLAQAPPSPLGGTVAAGIYDLAELDAYDADAGTARTTGRTARVTLVVTAATIRRSDGRGTVDAGVSPPAVSAVSYRIDGTNLVTTPVCPSGGGGSPPVTVPFSAPSETALALFVDGSHRELYTKR